MTLGHDIMTLLVISRFLIQNIYLKLQRGVKFMNSVCVSFRISWKGKCEICKD